MVMSPCRTGVSLQCWGATVLCLPTDHRVPVLWGPAEQVGAADLSPRVHEEPPGLPPRAPCPRLALPHLHVHARGVSPCSQRGSSNPPHPTHHLTVSHGVPCRLEQLGFNALLQLMIGVPLEMVHGILRISFLYLAGVLAGGHMPVPIPVPAAPLSLINGERVAGSLTVSITDMRAPLVGGSGGVYALCSAHLANVVMVSSGGTSGGWAARGEVSGWAT